MAVSDTVGMGMADLIAMFPRIITHRIALRFTTTMASQLLLRTPYFPPP